MPELIRAAEELQCILITHQHPDHIGGIPDILLHYGPVPVYKHKTQSEGSEYIHLKEGDQIQIDDSTLQVIETPGHSDDSISFWFPQEKAIFTGDIILGTGSTFLTNYTKYLKSMEKLLSFEPEFLYTAHGEAKVPGNKVQADLQHRKARESQILQVLQQNMKAEDIMRQVYGELQPALMGAALNNTRLYLDHLKQSGILNENNGNWYKL